MKNEIKAFKASFKLQRADSDSVNPFATLFAAAAAIGLAPDPCYLWVYVCVCVYISVLVCVRACETKQNETRETPTRRT